MAGKIHSDTIAFISTFPPRKCGIATFTKSLLNACQSRIDRRLRLSVVAVDNPEQELDYPDSVIHTLDQRGRLGYLKCAEFLNYSDVRAVSLQHEFGIYGGPDGVYILDLLKELRCPVSTTLHTILDKPSEGQKEVMEGLIDLSHKLVVMSRKGMTFLEDIYNAPSSKLAFIPHGVDNLPLVEPDHYKKQFQLSGRKVLLTFGLLSAGKGIENMINALPPVVKKHPEICYVVLGATHPEIVKREGEKYRVELKRITRELEIEQNVLFIDRFVTQHELGEFLKAADIYVTPYINRAQITSGTLAYALGAGKPVVSTNYWYAEELLDEQRGILVDVDKPEGLTTAVLELLEEPERLREMRAKAYEYSRGMVWSQVGQRYVNAFRSAMSAGRRRDKLPAGAKRQALPITGIPRPKLTHLTRLTDDTGLYQHALHSLPDRSHGYTTDDNARALVVAAKFNHIFNDAESRRLMAIYLSFLKYAQREDGLFHNFMGFDRRFQDAVSSDDCFGRSMWALGYVMYRGPEEFQQFAAEAIEKAIHSQGRLSALNPRGRAHAVLGLYYYLKRFPEAHDMEEKINNLAMKNMSLLKDHCVGGWEWFEPVLTYDNAILPHSMFLAYEVTGNKTYEDAGIKSLDFLMDVYEENNHFSFVGTEGWYPKGGSKARFDQQPLDACAFIQALDAAYDITNQKKYLNCIRSAFDWFLGVNDLEEPLYDFSTGGCADGLTCEGANRNQGAESAVCFLLSLLTLIEMNT